MCVPREITHHTRGWRRGPEDRTCAGCDRTTRAGCTLSARFRFISHVIPLHIRRFFTSSSWVAGEEWLKRKSQPEKNPTSVQQAAKLKCTLYEPIHFFYWQLRQLVTARGFLLVSGESPDVCRHRVVSPNALALRNCTDHILSWDNSFVCF